MISCLHFSKHQIKDTNNDILHNAPIRNSSRTSIHLHAIKEVRGRGEGEGKRGTGKGERREKKGYSSGAGFVQIREALYLLDGGYEVRVELRASPDVFGGDAEVQCVWELQ